MQLPLFHIPRGRGGITMEKITKNLDTSELEIKSIDEKKRIIWHKITKEVTDRLGDIVRIDGMDFKNFKKKPAVLYGHKYGGFFEAANPVPVIGKNIGFKKEGKALYAGTQFLPVSETEPSQPLKDLINDNWMLHKMKLLGWSIGIIPRVTEKIEKDDKFLGYDYKESELLEYSSVIIPANQEAVNDAFQKGLISSTTFDALDHEFLWTEEMELRKKILPKTLPVILSDKKEEELAGDLTEDMLTKSDIGKIKDDFEEQEDVETDYVEKPYKNEHACRLKDPSKYKRFTRGKRKHEGKEYSIIFGWYEKDDKEASEEQAYRYKKDIWTEGEAKKHCKDHKGSFEAAADESKCEDCEPIDEKEFLTEEEPGKQGLSPDNIESFAKSLYDLIQKRKKSENQLEKHLKNLKRR